MKRFLKWLIGLLEIIIIIYVICITTCLLAKNKYGFTQIGNMTLITINEHLQEFLPETKEKDLLIVKGDKKDVINVGDKIYYYSTHNEEYIIKSGYVKNKITDNDRSLYVMADEDGSTISSTRTIGKYSNTYGTIGGILDILESRLGFLLLVLLPILVIFIYQIYALIIVVKYTDFEDDEKKEKKTKQKKVEKKPKQVEAVKQQKEEKDSSQDIEVL